MEKFSQYRDRGSGIAPFFPIAPAPAGLYLPLYALLFAFRFPILVVLLFTYFGFLQWLPIGSVVRKAALWLILGVPGIWWVDLQIDGVKRGTLSARSPNLPRPGTIIAASSTSPLDPLYLSAIFDPIIATTYPHSRLVRQISLPRAILHQLSPRSLCLVPPPKSTGPVGEVLTTLEQLRDMHPDRIILVMAESTTTNGRGILPLSPALLGAGAGAKIFPTNLRYGPPDITTPIPGYRAGATFLWNLCSRPTHTIRVRIAGPVSNTAPTTANMNSGRAAAEIAARPDRVEPRQKNSYATNFLDSLNLAPETSASSVPAALGRVGGGSGGGASSSNSILARASDSVAPDLTAEEQRVLDRVAEDLARLGRVKRMGLGVPEKAEYVAAWARRR